MFASPLLPYPKLTSVSRRFPLWGLVALSFSGYLALCLWMPLLAHYGRLPLADVRTFSPSLLQGLLYGLLIGGLFALYAAAFAQVRQGQKRLSLPQLLLATLLFILPLLFTYPINATDIYRYVIGGQTTSLYDANPFATPPSQLPDASIAAYAGEWADATSPYGPVWETAAAAITRVSGNNLLLGLLMFKGLAALLHLAIAGLIWQVLAGQETAVRTAFTLLWAWNPGLLLTFVVDGHNDILMLFWLLLGVWVMRRGHLTTGLLLMVLAPLTKFIGLLPLPFFFLAAWRQIPAWRGRARLAAGTAVGALALVLITFLPFGSPFHYAQRLLYEATSVPGFSPVVLLFYLANLLGIPPTYSLLYGLGGALALTAVGAGLWLLWLAAHGRSPIRSAADIFALYIAQALSFRIWYAAWPFPWLLLDAAEAPDPRQTFRLQAGLWFLLTSQLSVLIYGHLRAYALGGSSILAHLVGVPFTFGLPLFAAWRQYRALKPAEE
ncbi:MAG: polyprenol phosphomannose-dependent alpha 1,6 mannosyltransferase MptB [Chloroflexi bacterium]|nr:polyprenol phosphomannose-dependent alpha 1,6 mannosyltransferase MptB [Chloroflexota bacterium]